MSDSISLMDLGLNEFRLDLLEYVKNHSDITKKPRGLHAVAPAQDGLPEGIIFVLKNINDTINVDNRNHIHPFYMVYISADGKVVCDYLNPKLMLDNMRILCRGKVNQYVSCTRNSTRKQMTEGICPSRLNCLIVR